MLVNRLCSTAAAVIDLCARAQLGISDADHLATLTVGAVVTWIRNQVLSAALDTFKGNQFTIVSVNESTGKMKLQDASGTRKRLQAFGDTIAGAKGVRNNAAAIIH